MADFEYESLGRPPRAGDVILYTEERIIPLGTWGVALEPFLTAYEVQLREGLQADGYDVRALPELSSIDASGAFTLTWTGAFEVLAAPPVPPDAQPDELEHLEAAFWTRFAWLLGTVALAIAVGWAISQVARYAEAVRDTDPDVVTAGETTRQTALVAVVLLAFAFLLWRVST